jgi:streptogramin lyase
MRHTISTPANPTTPHKAALLGLSLLATAFLAGCGLGSSSSTATTTTAVPSLKLQGTVFGGQQPVVGSTIQLYTVSTSSVGGASSPLIASTIKSLADGTFSITGAYTCNGTPAATQVYITATGGNSGAGTNSSLTLMAALGPCSALTTATYIQINELTTVAAAYALAPFTTDFQHIGAVGTNPAGLVDAFQSANLLVNASTGKISQAPAGMTLPINRLNALADIIAACVNSNGGNTSACNTLLPATGASETFGAALAFAKNPGSAALTALYALGAANAPFVPGLSAQPNDFTLSVNYTGAELLSPYGIAIDSTGNAWVTNEAGRSVVKAPIPTSSFATTTYSVGGLLAPRGISIDRSNNVWIANTGGNTIVQLNSAGSVLSGTGFTGGGISAPVAIANDSAGNAWVANFSGNSITELGTSGAASGASPIGSGSVSYPTGIALDSTGRVIVGNSGSGQLCIFSNAAALQSCASDGLLFGPTSLAVSTGGNVSLAGTTTGSTVAAAFTLATSSGTVVANSPGSGGGLVLPTAVAYDGSGNAWFANTGSISKFAGLTALSPATGFGSLNSAAGIAVDASGNIWTANAGDNSISIFIGLGTPIATPLAANVGP